MTSTTEERIELALENGDWYTLTEIAMELGGDEDLLASAERMKQKQHDEEWGYDEAKDNGELC